MTDKLELYGPAGDWRENINAKVEAAKAAKALATTIVDVSEDLKAIVKSEVGRLVHEELGLAITDLAETRAAIEADTHKPTRAKFIKWIDGLSNKLSIVGAGYRAGSLPAAISGGDAVGKSKPAHPKD